MIYEGLFDRYPELRVSAVETGSGWLPYILEQLDTLYWRQQDLVRYRAPAPAEPLLVQQLVDHLRRGPIRREEPALDRCRQHDVVH